MKKRSCVGSIVVCLLTSMPLGGCVILMTMMILIYMGTLEQTDRLSEVSAAGARTLISHGTPTITLLTARFPNLTNTSRQARHHSLVAMIDLRFMRTSKGSAEWRPFALAGDFVEEVLANSSRCTSNQTKTT